MTIQLGRSCMRCSRQLGRLKLAPGLPLSVLALRSLSSTAITRNASPSRSSLFTPSDNTKPFFATTPIFYVNAAPHIGHLHSIVLTDVLARFARLRNPDREVIFTTGTDEHGLKIQQAAKAQNVGEEEFCARVSERFKDLAQKANAGYTDFVRTSEARHYKAVEHFWQRLVESGDIYKGTHSGWYSISDECFYSEQQVKKDETSGKTVAIETGNEVFWEEEENWKFKLPKYRDRLLEWINGGERVFPASIRGFVVTQMETAEDLSISRPKSRVKWGVPVPGDEEQTIYVWVDALINYLTVLGYPETDRGWPADIHVVGKDIIKFHAVHWPALLMAAGHQPPQRVLSHAHWTMGQFKMSKSRGNVVDPISAIDLYGAETVRWYLMRSGGALPSDSDYSSEQLGVDHLMITSQLGNLLARIMSKKLIKNMGGDISENVQPAFDKQLSEVRTEVGRRMEEFHVTKACEEIMDILMQANKTFTKLEPWLMADTTMPVLYVYEALRIAGILLQPIMPVKAVELLDRLGVDPKEREWENAVWQDRAGVDVDKMRSQLEGAMKEWKSRGHLFPRVSSPVVSDTSSTPNTPGSAS